MPGHEPGYGGAEGYGLKERELNVELAQDLITDLNQNGHFDVFTTRDDNNWTPEFANYFKSEWSEIKDWMDAHVSEEKSLQRIGGYVHETPVVAHATAPDDVAQRLYGINKWVDENNIDIVVHIHFNDYPGHGSAPGKYLGFAIYVPEKQYDNSTTDKHSSSDSIQASRWYNNPVSKSAQRRRWHRRRTRSHCHWRVQLRRRREYAYRIRISLRTASWGSTTSATTR